jgi:uncharacterized protein YqjF (DUF2071 family)
VIAARAIWRLPYHHARMALDIGELDVRYASERRRPPPIPASCRVTCRPLGSPAPAHAGSLEHFLAERYLLYTAMHDGGLQRGAVHHAPYPLQRAEVTEWDETLVAAAGIARPAVPPIAHYAARVAVEIFALERVT